VGEQFWPDVWASALGDLIGGGIVALLIAVVSLYLSEELGVRQWAKDQKQRKRKEAETALRYVQFLEQEIVALQSWIPEQQKSLKDSPSGRLTNITMPVWEVLRGTEDLTRLFDPRLLTDTAHFYDILRLAKHRLDLMVQTWFLDPWAAERAPLLTTDLRDSAASFLYQASERAGPLLALYEREKERLAALVADATNGDVSTTRKG
jgi:hypothetical protein